MDDDQEDVPMEMAPTEGLVDAHKWSRSDMHVFLILTLVGACLIALKVELPLTSGGGWHPAFLSSNRTTDNEPALLQRQEEAPPSMPFDTEMLPPASPPSELLTALHYCPTWAPALGWGGAASALVFSALGSAFGTGKAGQGIAAIGLETPELVMKSMIPIIMAGVLGIYGLIIAVIISDSVKPISSGGRGHSDYSAFTGFAHLSAGLCCGLSGLCSGIAIGIVGDAGVRAVAQQRKVYVGMVLMLIFAEALGLYGLIVALILASNTSEDCGLTVV